MKKINLIKRLETLEAIAQINNFSLPDLTIVFVDAKGSPTGNIWNSKEGLRDAVENNKS